RIGQTLHHQLLFLILGINSQSKAVRTNQGGNHIQLNVRSPDDTTIKDVFKSSWGADQPRSTWPPPIVRGGAVEG
ncbi:hypothetical protein EBZ35_04260, partial [bacterium]|nr:hypothetical protein [bacterium]